MRSVCGRKTRVVLLTLAVIVLAGGSSGCAGPWPKLFPVTPVRTADRPSGGHERWYDVSGDGRADYCEILGSTGRLERIAYAPKADGRIDEEIDLAEVSLNEQRHLLIILDSVPVEMVHEFQRQGRLAFLNRPTRALAPFPVMTDPALTEFFGMAPAPVVEAAYYDGKRLRSGYEVYAHGGNTPWHDRTDYQLWSVMHAFAYLSQPAWFGHELRRIGEVFTERSRRGEKMTIGYVVSTSALGAHKGRDGHVLALVSVDRFCQQLIHDTRGRARITFMSDHGHRFIPSERIPLSKELAGLGYRVGPVLEKPGDVVVPEFGVVTCGALYTHDAARVAGDVVHLRGIELSAYRERGENDSAAVLVLSKSGRARITRSNAGFRYAPEVGDPLLLEPVLDSLRKQSKIDANGYIADAVLFEATADHVYPDAVARLWRAFHGLFVHVPDVFVSVEDGFEIGSRLQTQLVHMQATHGNLRPQSSWGFAASMAGDLPPTLRLADLRTAMQEAGVPLAD